MTGKPFSQRFAEDPDGVIKSAEPLLMAEVAEGAERVLSGADAEGFIRSIVAALVRSISAEAAGHDAVAPEQLTAEFDFCLRRVAPKDRLAALGAIEAVLELALLAPPDKSVVDKIRNRIAAKGVRPGAKSPFNVFIEGMLRKNFKVSSKNVEKALAAHEDFQLCCDGKRFETLDGRHKLAVETIPSTVSKLRKSIKENFLPKTG